MIKKIFLITDDQNKDTKILNDLNEHIKVHYKIEPEIINYNDFIIDYDDKTLFILFLSDEQIKTYLQNHLSSGQNIGILPTKNNPNSIQSYAIPKDIYEALDICFHMENYSKVDLLLCNSKIVFSNVIIGNMHGLNHNPIKQVSFINKLKGFFENFLNLSFKDYSFITSKEHTIQTSATGIMVLEHSLKKNSYIDNDFSLFDGKLNTFILSPTSKLAYLYYLFIVFFLGKVSFNKLPKSIGLVRTSKLNITSSRPIDFKIDNMIVSSKEIELEIKKESLNIALTKEIKELNTHQGIEDEKDTIKVQNLPKGDMKNLLIKEPVPLFKKAAEDEFKELFLGLKESAKLSSIFIVLMILSTLLATTGLFQNSAPVIIGAMVLAPLMAPIVSLAMGVVRGHEQLIKNSTKTLTLGIVTALLCSSLLTYFIPLSSITNEMQGRVNPNILDLIVAIISGIAGAYANSKSEVAKSLAGVAIAVALVPPLSVTGIGIGWGNMDMVYGSFLLFVTNLVGITLSAAITFIVLGYAPIHRAKKGIVYTSFILGIIIIPLVISFYKVIDQNNILSTLNDKHYIVNGKDLKLDVLNIDLSKEKPDITIEISSFEILQKNEFRLLKDKIQDDINRDLNLKISFKLLVE